jgi:hypothetical protein
VLRGKIWEGVELREFEGCVAGEVVERVEAVIGG